MGRRVSRKRIGVAETDQLVGVALRKALHVGAHHGELANAGDEFEHGFWAGEVRGDAAARPIGTDAGDLAAAHGDPEPEHVFSVEDQRFHMQAAGGVLCEGQKRAGVAGDLDELDRAVAQDLGALTQGVRREKPAQDDPEPLHEPQYPAGSLPGWFAEGPSHKLRRKWIEITREGLSPSAGCGRLKPST